MWISTKGWIYNFTLMINRHITAHLKQECIPVGCVPSATVAVCSGGGGCLVPVVVPGPGGCLLRGVADPGEGVCSWGGVHGPGGCLLPGGAWSFGGGSALGGGIPACTEADTPPPVNRMTERCKNRTVATSLRTVTISICGPVILNILL